jgi:hypothetical protein
MMRLLQIRRINWRKRDAICFAVFARTLRESRRDTALR